MIGENNGECGGENGVSVNENSDSVIGISGWKVLLISKMAKKAKKRRPLECEVGRAANGYVELRAVYAMSGSSCFCSRGIYRCIGWDSINRLLKVG